METNRNMSLRVKGGKAASLIACIVAGAFLIFGMVFLSLVIGDTRESEPELLILLHLFRVVWFLACGAIIAFSIYNMTRRKGAEILTVEAQTEDDFSDTGKAEPAGDFDERLRKLEGLRRDGLITEEEYAAKRAEIMADKW